MNGSNICDCGWAEHGGNANPHRKQCPECGAPFFDREVTRWFMHTDGDLDE